MKHVRHKKRKASIKKSQRKTILWTEDEISAAVETYIEMWKLQQKGKDFVKVDYLRELIESTPRRRRNLGTMKYRMRNISAIFAKVGLPVVKGYKPRPRVGSTNTDRILCIMKKAGIIDHYDKKEKSRSLPSSRVKTSL